MTVAAFLTTSASLLEHAIAIAVAKPAQYPCSPAAPRTSLMKSWWETDWRSRYCRYCPICRITKRGSATIPDLALARGPA